MVMAETLTDLEKKRLAWKIVLDAKANHQDVVASLWRGQEESFILEELRFQDLKLASPKTKLARFETFRAKWRTYATELGLFCDTTASLNDLQEKLLAGAWA
jgi:hypothetical protein